jgi:DNA-binding response OmpR family regulator
VTNHSVERAAHAKPVCLCLGGDRALCAWLGENLPNAEVRCISPGEDRVGPADLVVAHVLSDVAQARRWLEPLLRTGAIEGGQDTGGRPRSIAVLEPGAEAGLADQLSELLGVDRVLCEPVDRHELLREAARLLGVPRSPEAQRRQRRAAALREVWDSSKDQLLTRVQVLEESVAALMEGALTPSLRARAEREAHKIAGSAGVFGFMEGTRIARQVESALKSSPTLEARDALRLSQLVVALRRELEGPPSPPPPPPPPSPQASVEPQETPTGSRPPLRFLVADEDAQLVEQLAAEAAGRGFEVQRALSLGEARRLVASERPNAALIGRFTTPADSGLDLIRELGETSPPVAVAVLESSPSLRARVEVVPAGGRGVLPRGESPGVVMDAVVALLPLPEPVRVLAVDDDRESLSALRGLLEPIGFDLITVDDPWACWDTLQEAVPDALLLAVDMEPLSGVDLCSVVRSDPRWWTVPVLLLAGRRRPEALTEALRARADDLVVKPVTAAELAARIESRVLRNRIQSRLPAAYPPGDATRVSSHRVPAQTGGSGGEHKVIDIAVVEDDGALAEVLVFTLTTQGYTVERLHDGLEAVNRLGGDSPALRARIVLLDVDLPGLDGLAVLRRLGRDGVLDRCRVICLTARAAESEVLSALRLGAFDHVSKPFSVPVLLQRIKRAMGS